MTYNVTAIILKRRHFRESDLSVTLLTREFGKIEAAAVGGRKIVSKLAGQLEPFREIRAMLAKGRTMEKIGQAELLNNFGVQSAEDAGFLWRAAEAAKLVDDLTRPRQREEKIYDLLKDFFSFNFKRVFPVSFFYCKLLDAVGLGPRLDNCLGCGQAVRPGKNFLAPARGGLVCQSCGAGVGGEKFLISDDIVKVWRHLRRHALSEALTVKAPFDLDGELKRTINNFLAFQV